MIRRLPALFVIAIAANIVIGIASLATGPVHVPWHAVLGALRGRAPSSTSSVIVLQLRLPRVLSAALVGAGLALAGAVLQSLLRNPLAEPFTLGVSGGAGFFVTALAAFAPECFARPLAASGAGFAGALLSGALVFWLARRHGFTNTALILCGVILSFFFDSLVLVNFTVGRPEALQSAMTWLSGDFSLASGATTTWTLVGLLVPVAYMMVCAEDLDVMALGEDRAFCLGLPVARIRRLLFIAAALVTGVCVAAGGIIGFVGFMIPHLARLLGGARHRTLLPLAALLGAVFLMASDTLARSLFTPLELPVGACTGVIGAGFFLAYSWRGGVREVA